MGLMYGTGPLSRSPAGAFNFEPPPAGSALYLEPCAKRVRAFLGDEVVADSRETFLLHESGLQPVYYFPARDVRSDLLVPSDRVTRCPKKGEASYWNVRVGDRVEEAVAWYYPSVIEGAPPALAGLIAFYFQRMDRWLEEDEEIRGHPRDPYHRIDIRRSSSVVRVSVDGTLLAQTSRPMPLFETALPVRWYMPVEDVVVALSSSATVTHCPYKGDASYYSVEELGDAGVDLVWGYRDPFPGALPIKDLVCFWSERVELTVDGQLDPGSHAGDQPPSAARA